MLTTAYALTLLAVPDHILQQSNIEHRGRLVELLLASNLLQVLLLQQISTRTLHPSPYAVPAIGQHRE